VQQQAFQIGIKALLVPGFLLTQRVNIQEVCKTQASRANIDTAITSSSIFYFSFLWLFVKAQARIQFGKFRSILQDIVFMVLFG